MAATDTQTRVTTIHFASSTTHVKCNNDVCKTKLGILYTDMKSLFSRCKREKLDILVSKNVAVVGITET